MEKKGFLGSSNQSESVVPRIDPNAPHSPTDEEKNEKKEVKVDHKNRAFRRDVVSVPCCGGRFVTGSKYDKPIQFNILGILIVLHGKKISQKLAKPKKSKKSKFSLFSTFLGLEFDFRCLMSLANLI